MGGFCIYSEGVANRIGCGVEKKGGVKKDGQGFWSTAGWNLHLPRKRKLGQECWSVHGHDRGWHGRGLRELRADFEKAVGCACLGLVARAVWGGVKGQTACWFV